VRIDFNEDTPVFLHSIGVGAIIDRLLHGALENQLAKRFCLSQKLLAILYIHIVVQDFAAKYETLGKVFVVA
jgi:hypothetical protein